MKHQKQCECGYMVTAESTKAAMEALRDHQQYSQDPENHRPEVAANA